jgi:hypothetical protein
MCHDFDVRNYLKATNAAEKQATLNENDKSKRNIL